ncbi:MAG: methyltransferase [Acidimicrobiia bacterium]
MSHYFDKRPDVGSDRATVTLAVDDRVLTLATDRGVFSRGQIDAGTAVLLRKGPAAPTGRLLDLGCGYGPLALALAAQSPDAEVWAVDVNERALELVAENAAANELTNITVAAADAVPDELTFDAIYSNPPVRIGKEALHDLLRSWLGRLTSSGAAYLVVQRHLGADSLHAWLEREDYPTSRLASSKGYRVLEVHRLRAGTAEGR